MRFQRSSTKLAYQRDCERFTGKYGGTIPCSAEDFRTYIAVLAKRMAPATILRRCAAIQDAHVRGGHPSPTDDPLVREAMRLMTGGQLPVNLMPPPKDGKTADSIRRKIAKTRSVKPITRQLLLRMFDAMGTGKRTKDLRDKAIMLLGFSGLKRATICAIDIEDLAWTEDAMHLHVGLIAFGEGEDTRVEKGRIIAIPMTRGPLCAATACRIWLEHNDLVGKTGPLFCRFSRSGEPVLNERLDSGYVNSILKKRLKDAGIEDVSEFSAESLRAGHKLESVKASR